MAFAPEKLKEAVGGRTYAMPSEKSPPSPTFSTLSVRGGEARKNPHDALTTPIICSATYSFSDTAELTEYFEGKREREEYGRYGNPTVRTAERKIAALEGSADAALFSSGMAAVTTALLALLKAGDHVVMTSDCYRRTRQFVGTFLSRFGVTHTLVEPSDSAALFKALEPGKTRLIVSESPTNPYLRVADLRLLAQAKERCPGAKLLIDSTFATPINQRPLELGADLVVHSCTKYLGGHNDVMAGAICGRAGIIEGFKDLRGVLGPTLDAHSAYLLIRGLKTLALRVERQNANGMAVAAWLEKHPRVERVFYPGLQSHPDHAVAKEQMKGFGGVVSFLVKGGARAASQLIDACQIATLAPSLGSVETLIEQPSIMSYFELTPEQREAIGIKDNLVRLSLGIEDQSDLISDLAQALEKASG